MDNHDPRTLLLLCRTETEIKKMRDYIKNNPHSDKTANSYFNILVDDCMRYIEALKKAGIKPSNINGIKVK